MGDPASDQSEAQALAMMLQHQLDAINNEILLIQEEKVSCVCYNETCE